jgi:hypothetical protein
MTETTWKTIRRLSKQNRQAEDPKTLPALTVDDIDALMDAVNTIGIVLHRVPGYKEPGSAGRYALSTFCALLEMKHKVT